MRRNHGNATRRWLSRIGWMLLTLFCFFSTPTLAEAPATVVNSTDQQSKEEAIRTIEGDLAATREKLATGPAATLTRMVADGIATQAELDEWTLQLNLRIASLEKQLDAIHSLSFEINARKELQAQVDDWEGFTQTPPYSIDFIDDLWGSLFAIEQDIKAQQIAQNITSSRIEGARGTLGKQQPILRQVTEQAQQAERRNAPGMARLMWLKKLADERLQTTLTEIAQLEAILKFNTETLSRLQLEVDFLQRQIDVATTASPLTQEDLDRKRSLIEAKRVALERELTEAVAQENKTQRALDTARDDLKERQVSKSKASQIDHAQAVLDARKIQAETAMLRLEVMRLLIDIANGTDRIWQARFEVAHSPSLERLREMRAQLADINKRVNLWQSYLSNSLNAVASLTVNAEKRLTDSGRDDLNRIIAEAMVDGYQQRKAIYERLQTEIGQAQLLLTRWEQEIRARDESVPRSERWKDFAGRLTNGTIQLWNLEVFAVQDTVTIDGREITSSSSITLGKITTVILVLTLGLWMASVVSARIGLLMRKRFEMNNTAATLFERAIYILSIVALILIALDTVNIPLTVFAFLGGALAIGIGFGAQNLINNFISGLILLIERPISLGDLVEVEGVRGRVRNIGARCSQIRRADGIDMLIPNSAFLEKNVTNLTLTDSQLRVSVKIGVAYGSLLRDVTRLLEESVEKHGKVLKDPPPLILFEDFGDNALMFSVEFWVNVSAQNDSRVVASDLRHMIERQFREAGIVIAYPQRDIHLDQARPLEFIMKTEQAVSVTAPTV